MLIEEYRLTTTMITLSEKDIIIALKESGLVPKEASAELVFEVPGGGDWSNKDITISSKDPIILKYKVESNRVVTAEDTEYD